MKTTHCFLDYGHSTQTKNKLQAEFASYLFTLKGKLIDADKLPELKATILEKQKELNAKHPRCTPINISFWSPVRDESIMISGFGFVCFYISAAHYDSN